jgi:hypothetical protein
LKGLKVGLYTLEFKEYSISINIEVHKGVYWETDSFILKENSILENNTKTSFIKLGKVEWKENKEDLSKMKAKFKVESDDNDKTRVHICAFTFLPNNILEFLNKNINSSQDYCN